MCIPNTPYSHSWICPTIIIKNIRKLQVVKPNASRLACLLYLFIYFWSAFPLERIQSSFKGRWCNVLQLMYMCYANVHQWLWKYLVTYAQVPTVVFWRAKARRICYILLVPKSPYMSCSKKCYRQTWRNKLEWKKKNLKL